MYNPRWIGLDTSKLVVTVILLILSIDLALPFRFYSAVLLTEFNSPPTTVDQLSQPEMEQASGVDKIQTVVSPVVQENVPSTLAKPSQGTPESNTSHIAVDPLEVVHPAGMPENSPKRYAIVAISEPVDQNIRPANNTSIPETSIASCPTALPTRLKVGMQVNTIVNLNMRVDPSINGKIIHSNLSGTTLTIIGGSKCESIQGSAYIWWHVQAPDGSTGWSAEIALQDSFYFMKPLNQKPEVLFY